MCGLVGFINKHENLNTLQNMLKIQSYRGPDDTGIYFDRQTGVHLGHNRLSVQDLSIQGHQPFISDCGKYVIVFNGEVYNFISVREELKTLGYKFISHTDTEVILYSYKEWGIKCIDKFVGMFAFAILDKNKNKLLLVRDRAGVKPLYYYVFEKEFMFSSELKSFHKHPDFKKEQNSEVLPYFFQFGYIPAPFTIFKNCFKLEAGHYLKFDLLNFTYETHKYWDVNNFYFMDKFDKTEDEILLNLEDILNDAINLRMISDVPVGVFLSGGYDSSLVASILSKKQSINTFTIGFDDPKYNEAIHAKNIAKYLKTNHTEYYMKNDDIFDLIDSLSFFYDEPFGDSSALPTMVVSRIAKEKVSVALSADGGDEAFCGYSKYFFLNKLENIFSSKIKQSFVKFGLNLVNANLIEYINYKLPINLRQTNIKDKYIKFQRAFNSTTLEDAFKNASSYISQDEIKKLLFISCNDQIFNKWNKIGNLDFINQMMAIDYKLFMCDDVLTKVDRATMSVSLEGREPLLDHRIIEFMARVPLNLKYKNNKGKYLLRQILYKYIPKELVDKPKSGFTIPINEWLRGNLKFLVDKYLVDDKFDQNIFNIAYINKLKIRFFAGENLGSIIWFILVYQMWKEKWLE